MRFKLTPSLGDGKNDAPPFEAEAEEVDELNGPVYDAMVNDYGEPFGVGFTLTIERVA